jgi:hypothetical protein
MDWLMRELSGSINKESSQTGEPEYARKRHITLVSRVFANKQQLYGKIWRELIND